MKIMIVVYLMSIFIDTFVIWQFVDSFRRYYEGHIVEGSFFMRADLVLHSSVLNPPSVAFYNSFGTSHGDI